MELITTKMAPAAIGPYSQAVKANGMVYCSGQIPMTADGMVAAGDIKSQTVQVLQNLKAVLSSSGSGLLKVVKTTVYLASMDDFAAMNEVYAEVFGYHKPARATVEVARLPKDVLVEIDCIALAD